MNTAFPELCDIVGKAFPADRLSPPRNVSWEKVVSLGLLTLVLPEELGGLGPDSGALAAVHREYGRSLPTAPLLPALLALRAITMSDRLADKQVWIDRICRGNYIPAPMLLTRIERTGNDRVQGKIETVFEADMATHVLARVGEALVLVPTGAPGVAVTEREIWDPSRRIFDVNLDNFLVNDDLVVAAGADADRIGDTIGAMVLLALAAESLGAADTLLTMTVDYLKTRRQFGRPLAMFQALKHRLADLKVRHAAADALLWQRADDLRVAAPHGALKALSTQLFRDIAEESIQMHGGIGLTSEHMCHRFLKRALLNCALAGENDFWEAVTGRNALAFI